MALVGSEFESNGSGEINSVDMLKSGTSYVSHNLEGDTQSFSGSYAPVEKGVHQCGGAKKNKRNKKTKKTKKNKKNKKNNKSNKKRNNKKNKSQRKRR